MRTITEEQAQELATLSGCCVTQLSYGPASIWGPGDTPVLCGIMHRDGSETEIFRSLTNLRFTLRVKILCSDKTANMLWSPKI